MTCQVLRCAEPTTQAKTLTEKPIRTSVGLCERHWGAIEGGAPFHVDYQHEQQQLVVLMGEDLPLRFEKYGLRDHAASPDQVEVTLTLKRWDDSDELVKFTLPRDKAAQFTALASLRGRAQGM